MVPKAYNITITTSSPPPYRNCRAIFSKSCFSSNYFLTLVIPCVAVSMNGELSTDCSSSTACLTIPGKAGTHSTIIHHCKQPSSKLTSSVQWHNFTPESAIYRCIIITISNCILLMMICSKNSTRVQNSHRNKNATNVLSRNLSSFSGRNLACLFLLLVSQHQQSSRLPSAD